MSVVRQKGDIRWFVPHRRRPIAFSTKSTSDLIVAISRECGGTIREVQARINYDHEAKEVLQAYINRVYGEQIASEWFGY